MTERLQKLISASGLMSRRAAEEAISSGRVTVNGEKAALGAKADPDIDRILVDGKPLPKSGGRGLSTRVYPVGRLDMYSEGLLLLTNDGDFANAVMHPSHEVSKTYRTWVTGEAPEKAAHALRRPMEIDGYTIRPAGVDIVQCFPGGALHSITIREGRNRQVRKMCEQVGLKVTRLVRVSEGGLQLGDLKSGCWRHLTKEEVRMILSEGEN